MKITNKISIALCSVAIVSSISVGFNVNNKMNDNERIMASLRDELEIKDNSIKELEKNTKSLQTELENANKELASVKKEIEEIKN